jgi:peptide deformylase
MRYHAAMPSARTAGNEGETGVVKQVKKVKNVGKSSWELDPDGSYNLPPDELKIKVYPDVVLKAQSTPVECFNDSLARFVEKLRATMNSHEGVGLAAPQVGLLKKIAVVCYNDAFYTLINPKLLGQEGEEEADEGCLSFPGIYAPVKRPSRISVTARDVTGTERVYDVDGFLARAFLHEMDHLDGKLFIEYLSNLKRGMIRKKMYKRAVDVE